MYLPLHEIKSIILGYLNFKSTELPRNVLELFKYEVLRKTKCKLEITNEYGYIMRFTASKGRHSVYIDVHMNHVDFLVNETKVLATLLKKISDDK